MMTLCHHIISSCIQESKFVGNTLAHLRISFASVDHFSERALLGQTYFTQKLQFQSDGSATVFHNRPLISTLESWVGAESAFPPSKYWYALLSDDVFNFMSTGKGILHSIPIYMHIPLGTWILLIEMSLKNISMKEED